MRQAHLDCVISPEPTRACLCPVAKVGICGPRRDKLVAVLSTGLSSLVEKAVGVVAGGGRE